MAAFGVVTGAGTNLYLTLLAPFPASLAAGASYVSGPILVHGPGLTVTATLTQVGTLSIQRYADKDMAAPIGAAITQALTANTGAYVAVNDGLPYMYAQVTLTNTSGSTATASAAYVLCSQVGS